VVCALSDAPLVQLLITRSLSITNSTNLLWDSNFVNNTGLDGTTLFGLTPVEYTTANRRSKHRRGRHNLQLEHHLTNWIVDNGDDSISPKADSTDITIKDCMFYNGNGIAIGSIGQYKGRFETIERVHAENITYNNTLRAVYFKTWTGEQVDYPPNGGGGGLAVSDARKWPTLFADVQP
jgi:galacturan 1,4-alpha-galacturonidase